MIFSFLKSINRKILLICLLAVATFISFSPALKAQFLSFKDDIVLTGNPHITNNSLSVLSIFSQRIEGLYTPLTSLFFALEHHFFGFNPLIYHFDNLFLHLAVVVLVFVFALKAGLGTVEAFLGALIFAVHPSKVEAVAWVAQRKEMLCALFYLLSLICYQRSKFWPSLIMGFFSMLASPEAWSLPFVLAGMDWLKTKSFKMQDIFRLWPYFLIVLLIGALSYKSFLLLMRGVSVDLFSEHLFYIPSVFLSLALALGIGRLYRFLENQEKIIQQLFAAAIAMLIVGFMLLTYNQSLVWQNPVSLWAYQVKAHPSAKAYNHLAKALRSTPEYQILIKEYRQYMDLIAQGASENKLSIDQNRFKKVNELKSLYEQAIKKDSRYMESYLQLARLLEDIGKSEEALSVYQKALLVSEKSKEILFSLGYFYLEKNKSSLAVDTFNRILKSYPEDEAVYMSTIKAYGKALEDYPNEKIYKEQREEVLSDYEQITKRKKYTAIDYFNLGFLYEQVGGYEEAVRFYKKAISLKPNYEKALLNLANRYQQTGDFKSALLVYQQLLHFHPKNAEGYLNMGIIYNALGDAGRSRMLYQKAINLDSRNPKPYFYMGYLSESAGDLKDALNYYEKAVENDPGQAEAYYNMGNVYAALGQEAEAMASFLKTININKNHQNAYVNLSILSFKSRDFPGSIRYLEEAQLLGYNAPVEYLKSLEPYRNK